MPPFRKSGSHGFGDARRTNRLTVRSDDVEEEVHLVQHAILPGATKDSTRAKAMNGCGLDSFGRGVPNSTGQHGLHVLEDGGVVSADGQQLEGPKCKSRLSLAGFELDTLAKGANEVIDAVEDPVMHILELGQGAVGSVGLLAALHATTLAIEDVGHNILNLLSPVGIFQVVHRAAAMNTMISQHMHKAA